MTKRAILGDGSRLSVISPRPPHLCCILVPEEQAIFYRYMNTRELTTDIFESFFPSNRVVGHLTKPVGTARPLAEFLSLVLLNRLELLEERSHRMNNMDGAKQNSRIRSSLPGIANERPFSNSSRPEAHMITASQLRGATPVGGYSWRVCTRSLGKRA